MSADKIKKGKELLAALKFKKDANKGNLGNYTHPKYDEHYTDIKKTGDNMGNAEIKKYGYIKTVKGYDIYSYTSFIGGEVEGYIAVKEGFRPNRAVSLLKGLLAPSVKVLIKLL